MPEERCNKGTRMKYFIACVFSATLIYGGFTGIAPGLAQTATPKPDGHPTAAEAPFVTGVSADLTHRFSTTAAAEKAGYIRYTNEDETGAISYANGQWTSADPKHPSQLWYDVHGRLLGADFSVLQKDSPQAPQLWSVQASRWFKIGAHVHYGLAQADGSVHYGEMRVAKYTAAGGSADAVTVEGLVKAGVAKQASDVRFGFLFPAIWDMTVWVIPNPDGAFAEANPNVKPSHPATGM